MMGPVQEKETSARVKAMKKMLTSPVALSAFWSIFVVQEAGRTISKAPKKDAAKTTSSRKKKMLK